MSVPDQVNILLVDDQPAKLLTYEAMLDQLGVNLIKASSGREALEQLLRQEITLVLMDVSMPDLDGFELAEIIREHPRFRKTAIIFVSAVHLTDMDRLKGYASGAVDYVAVPVQPELLRAKVSVFTELRRKTLEAEHLARELERRVLERTAELETSTTKLREFADELSAADRRKDEFLALLAHELRNPLAPVLNAIGIMRARELDPELSWCRDVIERQAMQLTRLVDDLLDVSRISRGKVRLRFEPLELSSVVRGAVETSQPLIDAQRHRLRITQPPEPVHVHGDAARLIQVVANLVNNAAKYQAPGGTIDLDVSAADGVARITVADQGFGIDPELHPRIFEPFTQGNPALDRTQGGLGIGLYLVRNLVDLHGGSVTATSRGPGEGATFSVTLPLMQQAAAGDNVTPATPRGGSDSPQRVLVVDDNADGGESLVALLRLNGYDARLASDGLEALQFAAEAPPDIVLLDIGLPGMDGYEVCRRLRQQGLEHASIMALTGYGQPDRSRLDDWGFDNYVVKPCPLPELLRLLDGATARASLRIQPKM
jgi:signal transduction histidine kinase